MEEPEPFDLEKFIVADLLREVQERKDREYAERLKENPETAMFLRRGDV